MERKISRVKFSIPVSKVNRASQKKKTIDNQCTLIGCYAKLMENQKLIGALVKSIDALGVISHFCICFKIDEEFLPSGLKSFSLQAKNILKLYIEDCDPLSILVVVIATDSKDFFYQFNVFCASSKQYSIANFDKKIKDWFFVEKVIVEQVEEKTLPATLKEDFEKILERVSQIKKKERGKRVISSKETRSPVPSTSKGSKSSRRLMETPSEDQHDDLTKEKPAKKKITLASASINLCATKEARDGIGLVTVKKFASEVVKVLESTANILENIMSHLGLSTHTGFSRNFAEEHSTVRYIPKIDATKDVGNLTLIEGILPVSSRSYRAAMKAAKAGPLNAPSILKAIVKEAFPHHWLHNTTLRGNAGKKSLVSIWNYENPNTNPCTGPFINGLGESRLRAIFDHCVRKSKKASYDKGIKDLLINCISKTIHSVRKSRNLDDKNMKPTLADSESVRSEDNSIAYDGNEEEDDEAEEEENEPEEEEVEEDEEEEMDEEEEAEEEENEPEEEEVEEERVEVDVEEDELEDEEVDLNNKTVDAVEDPFEDELIKATTTIQAFDGVEEDGVYSQPMCTSTPRILRLSQSGTLREENEGEDDFFLHNQFKRTNSNDSEISLPDVELCKKLIAKDAERQAAKEAHERYLAREAQAKKIKEKKLLDEKEFAIKEAEELAMKEAEEKLIQELQEQEMKEAREKADEKAEKKSQESKEVIEEKIDLDVGQKDDIPDNALEGLEQEFTSELSEILEAGKTVVKGKKLTTIIERLDDRCTDSGVDMDTTAASSTSSIAKRKFNEESTNLSDFEISKRPRASVVKNIQLMVEGKKIGEKDQPQQEPSFPYTQPILPGSEPENKSGTSSGTEQDTPDKQKKELTAEEKMKLIAFLSNDPSSKNLMSKLNLL